MFPCTGCGLCCRNIQNIEQLKEYDLGNGTCKYFDIDNNSCNIYDDRPDICRVDKMFDIQFNQHFTREEFYMKNAEVCNTMQVAYKMDKSFRVKIGE
ncbi:MAG TPA: YkgJ family cysteine cluster protein [Arcobacter sp.]|nr:YkgJ family cysteine cluster protein [Arcobacter sp.]